MEMFCIQEVMVEPAPVLADLVKEMFCFQEVVVMPSYLADPVKKMFLIQ